jgi:hypothetical protein
MFDASDTATVDAAVNSATAAFPDLPSALSYIRSNWLNFLAIGSKIVALQTQVGQLAAQAAQLSQPQMQSWLQGVNTYLGQLDVMQGNMIDELDYVSNGLSDLGLDQNGRPASAVPDSAFGLGQIPVNGWTIGALLAGAVLIAGTIGYVTYRFSITYAQVQTAKQTLALVAQGKLTPQQGTDIINKTTPAPGPGVFASLQGITGYLALGAIAIFVLPKAIDALGKGRR